MRVARPRTQPADRPNQRGFTLVELLATVVVIGVLAAVALPIFNDSIRKGRRSEAVAALAAVQQAQERWRGSHAQYANNTELTLPVSPSQPDDPVGLGLRATTPSGYYNIAISASGDSGYTATATAAAGTSQALDTSCQTMAVAMAGGNVSYGSGSSSASFPDTNRCWAK